MGHYATLHHASFKQRCSWLVTQNVRLARDIINLSTRLSGLRNNCQEIKEYILELNRNWMRLVIIIVTSNLMVSLVSSEEISLGGAQAPISFIEYGSLTCDNCISFHRNVLPRIKKHYIDTGSVRFVFRHFPTSETAVHAAVAAQCAGEKYYEMLDRLYSTVSGWYRAENRNDIFIQQATSLELDSAMFASCLNDTRNFSDIVNQRKAARKNHDVTGTPTFFINGKIVRGKKSFVEIKALFSEALSKGS